jgi:photosystem II stability/assembly factor-like uncharacterized protein
MIRWLPGVFLVLVVGLCLSGCGDKSTDTNGDDGLARAGILMGTNEMKIVKTFDDGETWTVVFDPTRNMYLHGFFVDYGDPSVVTAWGGLSLWLSTDGGNSWVENDEEFYMDWTCCCRSWVNPDILYAGGKRILGQGRVARSYDCGRNWTLSEDMTTSAVHCITGDPTSSDILYVGTPDKGVLKSSDGGDTWSQSNGGLADGNSADVYHLAAQPGNPPVIWLTAREIVQTPYGPVLQYVSYTSSDHGSTWSKVGDLEGYVGIVGLAPEYTTLYAWNGARLSRSYDGGDNWTDITEWPGALCLFLDQADSALYVGNYDGLFRTTDEGATFTCLTESYEFAQYQAGVVATAAIH